MSKTTRHEAHAGGHYVTAGTAVAAMGSLGLVAAFLLTQVFAQPLGFIDGPSMAMIAIVQLGLGAWMIAAGRTKRAR